MLPVRRLVHVPPAGSMHKPPMFVTQLLAFVAIAMPVESRPPAFVVIPRPVGFGLGLFLPISMMMRALAALTSATLPPRSYVIALAGVQMTPRLRL